MFVVLRIVVFGFLSKRTVWKYYVSEALIKPLFIYPVIHWNHFESFLLKLRRSFLRALYLSRRWLTIADLIRYLYILVGCIAYIYQKNVERFLMFTLKILANLTRHFTGVGAILNEMDAFVAIPITSVRS